MREEAHRRGFTLVEVLLAVAILSVIVVMLLSSFQGAAQTLEILSDRAGSFRQLRIGMDRIGTDLSGAVSASGNDTTALTCRSDKFADKPASTLVFTAFTLPDTAGSRPPSALVKVRYFPRVSEDGGSIELFREQADLPLVENALSTTEVRLATRLQGFQVELYDGTSWTREWPPQGASKHLLPKKVSFILTDHRGQEFKRTVPLPLAGRETSVLYSGKRSGG